jgi:Xaa-Pro aminopeptidase
VNLLLLVVALDRIGKLRKLAFEEKSFDAFLVGDEKNVLYLTGTSAAFWLLVPKKGENVVFSYAVSYEQTKSEAKGFKVQLLRMGEKLADTFVPFLKASKIEKIALDNLSYDRVDWVARSFRGHARLKVQSDLIWKLRIVKDEEEIRLMRKAGVVASKGMQAAYETIRAGVTEIEVAAEIEYAMRKEGGRGTEFDTIVASGVRSTFAHCGCTNRKIHTGDLVIVDIGSSYEHYCSDMTRTIVAGKPSDKQVKIYEIVKTAQERAHRAIKIGTKCKDVDQAARKTIQDAGYGPSFIHSLGHGVGLGIHEPLTLSAVSKDVFVARNVVAIEPGIYLQDYGGVRIEDTVLVGRDRVEKLTSGPYTLETEK